MLGGTFEEFSKYFHLPHSIETFDGKKTIRKVEEFEAKFREVQAYFVQTGITDLVRKLIEAEFVDDKTLRGVHETRLLAGSKQIGRPYPVYSTFRRIGNDWKLVNTQYAMDDDQEHARTLTR